MNKKRKPRIAILFDNFGPYHIARLQAVSLISDMLAVEFGQTSLEYPWTRQKSKSFPHVVLNNEGPGGGLPKREFCKRLHKSLDAFQPEVVFVPGWECRGALLAMRWCLDHQIPIVLMSESSQADEARNPIKEWIKSQILSNCSAALVGGSPHRDYLVNLGMDRSKVALGYDAVDNAYFESGQKLSEVTPLSERKIFLSSARFVEKKNLFRLIGSYARYRLLYGENSGMNVQDDRKSFQPWDLLILGDGPLRNELEIFSRDQGLANCVKMPGFIQYENLPRWYQKAGCFIHASTTEQWGLVVNEAMASGLPVLVSSRCGCAKDLVREGENGWVFDPCDEEKIAQLMMRIAHGCFSREEMGKKSSKIISEWGPSQFAEGVTESIKLSLTSAGNNYSIIGRFIITYLSIIK